MTRGTTSYRTCRSTQEGRNISDQFWIAFFSTLGTIVVSIVTTGAAVVVLWLKIRETGVKSDKNAEAIHEVKGMVNGKNSALQDKVEALQGKVDVANANAAELVTLKAGMGSQLTRIETQGNGARKALEDHVAALLEELRQVKEANLSLAAQVNRSEEASAEVVKGQRHPP